MLPSLSGIWIGTTRDDNAAQHWRMVQRGDDVHIFFTYEEQPVPTYCHIARIVDGILRIRNYPRADAVFVSAEHFVLPNWEGEGNMLFSREGLAEMMAPSAWVRYDEMMKRRDQL